MPGVQDVPDELGFLKQKHWVSFDKDRNTALHEIESGVRGSLASPYSDVLICYNNEDIVQVRNIEAQLRESGVDCWKHGLNASSLQLSVLRDLDNDLNRIWSLAVVIGSDGQPWEQDIIADLILEFREGHRPVIPVILETVQQPDVQLPVYLRRLGAVDFRTAEPPPIERLVFGIIAES